MYVSFDDGDDWQSLMLNLPNTSYRDIVIKDNDLVVGTYGRSFWILDDYLAAAADDAGDRGGAGASLQAGRRDPRAAQRERRHAVSAGGSARAESAARRAHLLLARREAAGDITLEVLGCSGQGRAAHVERAASRRSTSRRRRCRTIWLEKLTADADAIGTNRINWNIRYDNPPTFTHNYEINANAGETPASPEGPLALPGTYTLKLTVDGKAYTQTVKVKNDPRSPATAPELRAQHELQMKLYAGHKRRTPDTNRSPPCVRRSPISKANPPAEVAAAITALEPRLVAAAGPPPGQRGRGASAGNPGPTLEPPAFAVLNGTMIRQLETLDSGDMAPNEPQTKAYLVACTELHGRIANWAAMNSKDLVTLNALLSKNNIKSVVPAKVSELVIPVC